MYPRYLFLNEKDRGKYWEIRSFVNSRLTDNETISWALKSDSNNKVKRLVFSDLLESTDRDMTQLSEPWRSAWEVIVQNWASEKNSYSSHLVASEIRKRLENGDHSMALIEEIVKSFKPILMVKELATNGSGGKNKKPNSVTDLISLSPSGGDVSDLQYMKPIEDLVDVQFLTNLTRSLQNSFEDFYYSAYRSGLGDGNIYSYIASIINVKYCGEEDPDRFKAGLETPAKLFHLMLNRLSIIDKSKAIEFLSSLETKGNNLGIRIWASIAASWLWIEPKRIGTFLLGLDDHQFWETSYFPEVAELRASRFSELEVSTQIALWTRIRHLPPRRKEYRKYDSSEVHKWRVHSALIETKRIEQAGAFLNPNHKRWVEKVLQLYPEFGEIKIASSPYRKSVMAHWLEPMPDANLDALSGSERLSIIEKSLANNDSRRGIIDWMRNKNNLSFLIEDFSKLQIAAWTYPQTLGLFCSEHKRNNSMYSGMTPRNMDEDYRWIFSTMYEMPNDLIRLEIHALTEWLDEWKAYFKLNRQSFNLWNRILNIANDLMDIESKDELVKSGSFLSSNEYTNDNNDSRNYFSPVARLTEIFFSSLPNLKNDPDPFRKGSYLLRMRSTLMKCTGASRDIILCRFAEQFHYLLSADRLWTKRVILEPLRTNTKESRGMWESLSHQRLAKQALKEIGDSIIQPCTDKAISIQARHSLILSVIWEQLDSYRENNRKPFISKGKVSQMLYALNDETRAYSVEILTRFINKGSDNKVSNELGQTPEYLFSISVQPFLKEIWPKDRSLTSPIVAKAFARLPAATCSCFSTAVDEVERYIEPFSCYSMYDFGFHIGKDGRDNENGFYSLKRIITSSKLAKSLLRLLDRSIAYTDEPIHPLDLADVLSFISSIAPEMEEDPIFFRLSMLSNKK